MTPEQMADLVDKHVAQLGEHFDTVRIFVSKHDSVENFTESWTVGAGNFLAQKAQVNEWLDDQHCIACDDEPDE